MNNLFDDAGAALITATLTETMLRQMIGYKIERSCPPIKHQCQQGAIKNNANSHLITATASKYTLNK